MRLLTFKGALAGVGAVFLCLGGATVPAVAEQTPPPLTAALPGTTIAGCGMPEAAPVHEMPIIDGNPVGITLSKDGSRLYSSQELTRLNRPDGDYGGTVSVFDTESFTEAATMKVPGFYTYGQKVTLNPSGTKGYFPTNVDTIQVFDAQTNTMTTTIPVYSLPREVVFNRDGTRAYVLHFNDAISVLDTVTDTVIALWQFDYHIGTFGGDLVLDPTGTYAYVAAGARIRVIDLASGAIVDEIPLGGPGGPLVLTADGSTLYSVDSFNQRTVIVDMVSRTVKGSFPVVGDSIVLSATENRAYMPSWNRSRVQVVDLTINALICSLWFLPNGYPGDIALSPDNHTMYAVNSYAYNRISVLNLPEEKNPTFSDVPAGTLFHREINWMAAAGITTGYDDGTYHPMEPVRRDAMAAFLYRFHGSQDFVPPATSPFTDVQPGDKFYKEITWLADMKISEGWPDKTYRPDEPVNRDAMAAFMYRTINHVNFVAPSTSPFVDVQPGDQFYLEISFISAMGISTGWSDGTYRPLQPVNRDAMAAFLFRLNPFAPVMR